MNSSFYNSPFYVFSLFLFFSIGNLQAQQSQFVAGDLLIQFTASVQVEEWVEKWNEEYPTTHQLSYPELVSRPVNIWLLHFDEDQLAAEDLLKVVWEQPEVIATQRNHRVRLRSVPNDALFDNQWQYQNAGQSGGTPDADIDAVEAWDHTTGGTTISGDTIVVAVLDNGIDGDHPDLQRNRWINHAEIPNNDFDDDGNGYEDDYLGWNILNNSDQVEGGGHGTAVAGIVGADGDNELGVTGVNWNVKVMIIRNNFNTTEAKVLEAYSYALEQRQRYNNSGGAEGAFVVATNASWGVDGGDPENAEIWCGFYDVLGAAGIINCGATANNDVDVETEGDLPTGCASDYLISVTNTDHNDVKEQEAGYGAISIDLSAPGTGVYTIANNGGYGAFGGTSSATPHVAGAAALLYSLDCPALMALVQADPAAAALLIKDAILEGVDPIAELAGITVTGGRLNVANSVDYLLQLCDGCLPASSVQVSTLTDTEAGISWMLNDSLESVDLRWRVAGTNDWTLITDAQSPLLLTGLTACQDYEYQLQSNCFNDVIPFQSSRFFKTDGCCDPPANVQLTDFTTTTANFSWDMVLAAVNYEFRYREINDEDWTTLLLSVPNVMIQDLESCHFYEFQVRTVCAGETTNWTESDSFVSAGCGPCLEEDYCIRENVLTTTGEYIERIEVGGFFSNISDGAANGYQDFGGQLEAIELEAGQTYPIVLTPGFTDQTFPEDWRIWLDIDHNGDFTSNEIIFDTEASNQPINGSITIPADANLGVTRMRVVMEFNVASSPCPITNSFGEMEDYCVNITPSTECPAPGGFVAEPVIAESITISWDDIPAAVEYEADFRFASGGDWLPLFPVDNNVVISGLDSCENYILRVKTICTVNQSLGYSTFEFDACPVATHEISANSQLWELMPNPFHDQVLLQRNAEAAQLYTEVVLVDALGRSLQQINWINGQTQLKLDGKSLPAGLYTLLLYQDGELWSAKRIVKE